MKKNIVIAAVFIALLNIHCKKNENNTDPFQSYLRFKIDNVQTECNAHIKATYMPPTIGPDNIISISGSWGGGSIELGLNEASSGQVLTTGTYTFLPGMVRSGELWITTFPSAYYSGFGGGVFNPLVLGSGQVTFSEVSPGYVKGSFECVLTDLAGTTLKVITSGEFHIKRG